LRHFHRQPAPTPEQLRQDDAVPWQEVTAFAAGQVHTFRVKTLAPLLWKTAGADRLIQELFPSTGRATLVGVTGAPGT